MINTDKQLNGAAKPGYALDELQKDILLYLANLSAPVSIDTIVSLSDASVATILSAIEGLRKKNLVYEKKEYGKGAYFLRHDALPSFGLDSPSTEDNRKVIEGIIDYYKHIPDSKKGDTEIRNLADLYMKIGDTQEGLAIIKKAADILSRSGQQEEAVTCYDYVLQSFSLRNIKQTEVDDFLDSVIGRVSLLIYHMAAQKQFSLLNKARSVASKFHRWDRLARIEIVLAQILQTSGEHEKAFACFTNYQKLADKLGDQEMAQSAILVTCEFLFWKGRFSEVVGHYEKMIGSLEEFGDDEASLKAAALVGCCFVICGRIARGLGMIETVRAKGALLALGQVAIFTDLMTALSLFEIRRTSGAEVYLERLQSHSEHALGYLISRAITDHKAYVLCARGAYREAFQCHQRGVELARSLGWKHQCGPWVFEYLDILETKGFVDKEVNYDSEVNRLVKWDDLRMKGAAFRYQAMRNMERGRLLGSVRSDLKTSEKYLKQSGAEIELARTRIALGRYHLMKKEAKTAKTYLDRAWAVLSRIDVNLFPNDLLEAMSEELKLEVMMERVIGINELLGVIRDRTSFLEKVIEVAMDFVLAMRGCFIILEADGKLKQVASRNLDPFLFETDGFKTIMDIIAKAVGKRWELVIPLSAEEGNIGQEKDIQAVENTFRLSGINSFIGIPACLADHTYGYLCLDNRLGGEPFPRNQLPFIRFLCSQIAVGLSDLDTYKEMKELKDRFEEEAIFYKREMGVAAPIGTIVGKSDTTKRVIEQIRQVAPTDSSVMILGETGVGKELVAKAIHSLSKRKDGPFIPVNIAALPHDLVASELFGHEKGAFTGANERQKGRFELAHGGTIFLDEIGDLPVQVQTKLLRVLQEGVFERLGSGKAIESDFRVIAATNKDLRVEVEKGAFRRDLYYRLHVFPLDVPPLRDRKEDIPVLARYFADKFGRKFGKSIKRIPSEEMKKLVNYVWPGNVRELEHCIEKAVILFEGNGMTFPDLLRQPKGLEPEKRFRAMPMMEMERDYIEKILSMTNRKVMGPGGAASILQMKPTTLFSRMKKLGIKKSAV